MSLNSNGKLIFIDSFQFLSSSLDSLVKNFIKGDFSYLSKEFDSKVLDLVKHKGSYPYEYMGGFKRRVGLKGWVLKKNCHIKKSLIVH